MDRKFTNREAQMTDKNMKRCSTFLRITERANKDYFEILLYSHQNGKKMLTPIASGNVKWGRHSGKGKR